MAEIKWDDIVNKVGEKIVNEYIYKDKPLREWIDLIVDYEPNKMQEQKTDTWSIKEVADALERHGLLAPKAGHWIMHLDNLFPADSTMECSVCGEHQPLIIDDNYCPNCGARMKSEVSE